MAKRINVEEQLTKFSQVELSDLISLSKGLTEQIESRRSGHIEKLKEQLALFENGSAPILEEQEEPKPRKPRRTKKEMQADQEQTEEA